MSVSLLSRNVARKLLFIPVTGSNGKWTAVQPQRPLLGHFRCMRRFGSGLAKSDVYNFCLASSGAHTSKGRVAWTFAFGEAFKVLLTFALLAVALAVLKVVFLPLIVTWVLVLVVQVLAPAVINNKG